MTFLLTNLHSSLFPLKVVTFSISLDTLPTLLDEEFSALLPIFHALHCVIHCLQIPSCYFEKLERTHEILF